MTSTHTPVPVSDSTAALAGKYLTFALGGEGYGIPVTRVREIIRPAAVTAVPRMPGFIKGVINLRGKIIPIVDLRLRFGLSECKPTERSCMVILNASLAADKPAVIGLVVDAVEEVIAIAAADLEPAPDFGASLDTRHIRGLAKIRRGVITLLNLDTLLNAESVSGWP